MINFHLMKEQIYLLINSCKDVLIMHLGSLQEAIDLKKRKMINPIFCFCIGIRCILGMPIKVLEWSGVISSSSSIKIAKSRVSTLISGIVAVVSLIGSIITIIIGWDEVVELVHSIF